MCVFQLLLLHKMHAIHIVRPLTLLILLCRDMQLLEDRLRNSESLTASAEAAASISRAEAGRYGTKFLDAAHRLPLISICRHAYCAKL